MISAIFDFQYPLRVEVGCNPVTATIQETTPYFQYPLRVEVGCNDNAASVTALNTNFFSTLYGSKWVATY